MVNNMISLEIGAAIALLGIFITCVGQLVYIAYMFGHFAEKLKILEEKQDEHNNVIKRTYILESRTDVQEEQIKVANHRIDDLERRNK